MNKNEETYLKEEIKTKERMLKRLMQNENKHLTKKEQDDIINYVLGMIDTFKKILETFVIQEELQKIREERSKKC
jgi:sulfur relay (sulfurtransferase) DsrC/TusE family protein